MHDLFRGNTSRPSKKIKTFALRRRFLVILILLGMLSLVLRAINLQVIDKQFLQQQGAKRYISKIPVSTYRGKIFDRYGEIMAISSPVRSIWVNPRQLDRNQSQEIEEMTKVLGLPASKIKLLKDKNSKLRFSYLKRRISPGLAMKVKKMGIKGIHFDQEFKRFYPAGVMSAHLIGFTDVDDVGQEGIERTYEDHLKGKAGLKRIIRDGRRRIVEDFENLEESVPGKDLTLSVDRRIQYLAFRELQHAFIKYRAKSASLVVLDAKTGDVLAAVTQPAFNPNSRKNLKSGVYRNRAITDVFEPGSTMKPFVIAAALDGKYIAEDARIRTNGSYKIGVNWVRDGHNYGVLSLTNVLKKSSNVGASKVALLMPDDYLWRIYKQLGFGQSAEIGFPGEAHGILLPLMKWNDFAQATLSFGYGLSTSTLQLAKAYTALADNGILHSVSLLKRDRDPNAKRIFTADVAKKVRTMLEEVVKPGGTAKRAAVTGYRVAGKTGTAKKAKKGGYSAKKYFSVFVGMAPASNPRFVIAVMVDEPKRKFYGGLVAAPVFSKVMAGTLRIYGVEPDKKMP
ncbi:MAG: penicillin-binding protein 2 [Methylococcales bacterium]|nr:penicillin-binding protein 2 [Methylococcales bacterium]